MFNKEISASLICVASHGYSQLVVFFSLSKFLVSVELPPFPGIGIIGDPLLFSVGVSGLRQLLHSLVSSNCTLEKRSTFREESQATGMPRQMADWASARMWNTFLLSELVIPVLSVIVWAT